MSIQATFYKVSEDPLYLTKDISDPIGTATCTLKSACSVLSPVLVLKYNADLTEANYVHLPDPFNRYYFLSPPVVSPGKRMTFTATIDPLMSWANDIKNVTCVISRNRTASTSDRKYLTDSNMPVLSDDEVHNQIFLDSTFGSSSYVLSVVGGVKND